MSLPAGVALAARVCGGRSAWASSLLGLAVALLALGAPGALGVLSVALVGAASWAAGAVLHQLAFDARLERALDVGMLAAVGGVMVAAPLALGLATGLAMGLAMPPAETLNAVTAAGAGNPWLASASTGWVVLALGVVAASTAALALERSLSNSAEHLRPGWRSAAGLGLLLAAAGIGSAAAGASSAWVAAAAWFLPPLLLLVLALREQFTWASCGLVLVGLLGASQAQQALFAAPSPTALGAPGALLAGWLGGMLAAVLLGHAATVQWRGRAQRWEWALEGSRLGVADWHLGTGESFASGAWRSLSGHIGAAWSPRAWRQRVHADDQAQLNDAIQALSTGQAGRRELELRMPGAGGWRWAEATLMVIERDGAGRPLRLLATLADIHDKREALERQRLSANLFQHLHEGLLITDPDLRALDVNPAYTQILGVPREEIIGTVPSLLRPAPDDPVAREQRAAMWASLRDLGHWRGELLEPRRNGPPCMLHATISTVPGPLNADGSADARRYHVLVISDITEQQSARDQLERQAHFDELTGLPNRSRLSTLLQQAMLAADRDGHLLVVCYLDLDHFKPVNDQHGHAAGDRLLAELAGRLRSALRGRPNWTDAAARLGGDEFVLLLRAGTLEEARMAVERVLRVVSLPYVVEATAAPVQVTASMGATVYPIDRSDADALLRHADHAMYGAKQAGRNGYLFFDPEQRRRTEQRVLAIGRIQEALDRQELVLHYQPKVDMKRGHVLGFEALLRWEHPQQGLVPPLQFLPIIENTGLSSSIGDWVIAHALEHLANWRRDGFDFSVSVNVSARHLQEPDFAQRLGELLARHAEPLAGHLELEMLETTAHADIEATSALVARCQAMGVKFALDDFGTGYSTLTYLKRLPVDVLKIDRSFVHHMLDDDQDRAIVQGVIGLAGTFGCTVVAEGVESPAQARTLLELGCEIGQGTGIAAPMPVEKVAAWVRDYKGMFALASAPDPLPPSGPAPGPSPDGGVARLGA
ncbi:diguanylate cyclase [beta proteobacterium AAP51]|nr:diguanylate cyclase [beta proteobacterium AAP51]